MNTSPIHRRLCLLTIVTILVTFLLLAIYELRPTDRTTYRNSLYHQMLTSSSLSRYADKLFQYEVTQDSITTAYHLRHPEQYGIPNLPATLSSFSAADYKQQADKKDSHRITDLLTHLTALSNRGTTTSEQINYTLMNQYLSLSHSLSKYPYYDYLLGASTGVQTNLPVTLCEYPLSDRSSVKTYLQLLDQIPEYFEEVISYDQQRNSHNISTPAFLTASSTEQLATFLTSLQENDNCFTETFAERLTHIEHLSADDRSQYEDRNRTIL